MKQEKQSGFWTAAFGISFVWFTTQFGGGFASGAQMKTYFLDYGIWALTIAVGTQVIGGFYNWYVAYYARRHETYNYHDFNRSFYGKYAKIFMPLYELVYAFLLLVVPAVAFATGGATMELLTGIPYGLSTGLIGMFIFGVALYGTDMIRKVATVLSLLIIGGLLAIFIPNVFVQWDRILQNFAQMQGEAQNTPFLPALWSMIVCSAFHIASFPAVISQHASILPTSKDAKGVFLLGTGINTCMMVLSVIGLMAIVHTEAYATASTPVLVLVQEGPGSKVLAPLISILIILGSVSNGVNMISAAVARILPHLDKNYDVNAKPTKKGMFVTGLLAFAGFCVAQFGLLPLISTGYGILAYLAFPVILLPYPIHMIVTRFDTKTPATPV